MQSSDTGTRISVEAPEALLRGHPALVRLQRYMRTQDPMHLSMAEAAAAACVEPHYFSALFHRYTGMSFIQWRRAVRTARASQLIASGALSIEQIVHVVGYGDRRSLERAVKALLHVTPKSLRSAEVDSGEHRTGDARS